MYLNLTIEKPLWGSMCPICASSPLSLCLVLPPFKAERCIINDATGA